jgi:hypothetical protein
MFGQFNHPKPVNPTRPVAEFSARQTVNTQSKSTLLISENNRVPPTVVVPSEGTVSTPITFTVRYRFTEWLAFILPHSAAMLVAKGKLKEGQNLPWYIYLFAPLALMIFTYKKYKLPICSFSIDQNGVIRRARDKVKVCTWDKFDAAYSYPPGILLALKNGAMLIPRRGFSASQWLQLKTLIHAHLPQA